MAKKALGKGLDALINEESEIDKSNINEIEIEKIIPNPDQPRKSFDKETIRELAESIKKNGVIQPIILRRKDDKYEIVVGERRYKAAKEAGLKRIPALIKDYSDSRLLEIALIENIQRKDLNPIEEALAYKTIINRDTITQEELSKRVGKSRSYIANMIRLLELPEKVKEYVSRGTITVGHAKVLVSLDKDREKIEIAENIIKKGLSVRQVENIVKEKDEKRKNVSRGTDYGKEGIKEELSYIKKMEDDLIGKLGTKVKIIYRNGKGSIIIDFFSDEDLERLVENIL